MPAPHGHEKREKPFALRMNETEDSFVRQKAREWGMSLKLAICSMIQHEQQRERYAELVRAKREQEQASPPPPAPAPAEAKPRKPRKRPAPVKLSYSDVMGPEPEQVPGQMPLTDDEQ
jgi:hypothetical protein